MNDTKASKKKSTKIESIDALEGDTMVNLDEKLPAGAILSAARERKKLTVQDVAQRLRISVKQVEAMEQDSFDLLPDAMIARGFIRNYARLLEVDATPVLQAHKDYVPDALLAYTVTTNIGTKFSSADKNKKPWVLYIVASGLVLLGLLAWLIFTNFFSGSKSQPVYFDHIASALQSSTNTAVTPNSSSEMPEVALPVAERQTELATTPVPGVTSAATALPKDLAAVTPAPIVLPAVAGETMLHFSAKATSWVSVRDAMNNEIYSKTLVAGSEEDVPVHSAPPIKVKIGNVAGTVLTQNGNLVDLTPYQKSNVAKLVLN